jgi:hypothetical protein
MVNHTFARRYFGNKTPIGNTIIQNGTAMEIVGFVGDTKYEDIRQAMQPTVYYNLFHISNIRPLLRGHFVLFGTVAVSAYNAPTKIVRCFGVRSHERKYRF